MGFETSRSSSLLFTALALALLGSACAPRVSKQRVRAPLEQAPVVKPLAVTPVRQDRPVQQPAPVVAQQPVVQPVVVTKPVVAPVQTARVEEPEAEPEESVDTDEGYAHEEKVVSADKKSFYSFSDDEVTTMRRKNRDFKKLHDKLKTCTSRSEKTIAKREQLRDKIIALQNADYRTPKQDVELRKLRDNERKMLSSRGDDANGCNELEGRLTEMLKSAYAARG